MRNHSYAILGATLLAAVLPLAGCASLGNSILARPFQENDLDYNLVASQNVSQTDKRKKVASVVGLMADRRGIIVNTRSPKDGVLKDPIYFCAEPPPDVAMSTAISTGLALKVSDKGEASMTDALTTLAKGLATRTPLVEAYRTAVFALCQMHMNGAISNAEAAGIFSEMTLAVIKAIPGDQKSAPPDFGKDPPKAISSDAKSTTPAVSVGADPKPTVVGAAEKIAANDAR